MIKKIQEIFKKNNFRYDYAVQDNIVVVTIEWGDWKHDHTAIDYVMKQNGFSVMGEQITEEDGSDCYSSIHTFRYKQSC